MSPRDFLPAIESAREKPFHVGLTGANPDLANENVGERDFGTIRGDDLQDCWRGICGQRCQPNHPAPIGVGGSQDLLAGKTDRDRAARGCGAPDGNRDSLLEDNSVGEEGCDFHRYFDVIHVVLNSVLGGRLANLTRRHSCLRWKPSFSWGEGVPPPRPIRGGDLKETTRVHRRNCLSGPRRGRALRRG